MIEIVSVTVAELRCTVAAWIPSDPSDMAAPPSSPSWSVFLMTGVTVVIHLAFCQAFRCVIRDCGSSSTVSKMISKLKDIKYVHISSQLKIIQKLPSDIYYSQIKNKFSENHY